MALYAIGEEGLIHVLEADPRKSFLCIECRLPMKVRRGKYLPHFYHLKTSPSCRLYSKSEDHLLMQLQVKNFLSPHKVELEKPLLEIHRVADIFWEEERIVFEVQCSHLSLGEAQKRISDYASSNYHLVWLLDDRKFNRRLAPPSEILLRKGCCYYFSFDRDAANPSVYDQLEVMRGPKRVQRGERSYVTLRHPQKMPYSEKKLPRCLSQRFDFSYRHFKGDLIDRACSSYALRKKLPIWIEIERRVAKEEKTSWMKLLFRKLVRDPYLMLMDFLITKATRY